jgi:hypothetical protein
MTHDQRINYNPSSGRNLARTIAKLNFIQRTAKKKYTKQNDADANDNALARYTLGLFIATCVIAAASLLTFGAALLQWNALQSTDTATRDVADAALKQASAAEKQVTAMQTQLSEMHEQVTTGKDQLAAFEREARIRLRAYVSAAIAPPPTLQAGTPRDITLIAQAGGQSPAIDLIGWMAVGIGPYPIPDSMKLQERDTMQATDSPTPTTLNPGNTVSLIVTAPAFDQVAVDAMKVSTYRTVLWGHVRFSDVFGCKRWVNFCFSINDAASPPRSDSCTRHNGTDTPPDACPATFPP